MSNAAIIRKTKTDALLPRDAGSIARRPLPDARRPPLGLSIVDGPEDGPLVSSLAEQDFERGPFYDFRQHEEQHLAAGAPTWALYLAINAAVAISYDVNDAGKQRLAQAEARHAAKAAELQLENSQLKAMIAELRATLNEHSFVLERLKIENKGPVGPRGMMGRDGRDGVGKIGPAGPAGPRGEAALRLAGWTVDESDLSATPIMSDGSTGPALRLGPAIVAAMDAYSAAVSADDEA